jgi:protein-S-isoprenylcysteine O-methyltransferase Ste14
MNWFREFSLKWGILTAYLGVVASVGAVFVGEWWERLLGAAGAVLCVWLIYWRKRMLRTRIVPKDDAQE